MVRAACCRIYTDARYGSRRDLSVVARLVAVAEPPSRYDGVAWRGPVDRSIVATVGSVVCGRVDIRI
jgi:hypothetical protein